MSKLGPGALKKVLEGLPNRYDPRLLVGFDTSDDACVYQLSDKLAVIQTVDFFPPVVDDPYLFGQIAAANALSDVYAMGGRPVLALNLFCASTCLGEDVLHEILRGGAEKAVEAGCVIAGGHTIEDPVPKYGLCVTWVAEPEHILRNAGALPGDALVLTKALGVGVMLTALKAGFIQEDDCAELFSSMAALNDRAARAMEGLDVHACTDVTGFGLLGHALEMASGSGVTLRLSAGSFPLLKMAEEMASMGMVPAGAYRNKDFVAGELAVSSEVAQARVDLAADPQTSGGLLIALPEEKAGTLLARLAADGLDCRIIGRALPPGEKLLELVL